MKVSAILKGPKDEYGRTRVYIRVNDKFKRKFYPTNIKTVSLDKLSKGEKDIIKTLILKHETGYSKKREPIKFSVYVLDSIRGWERTKKESTLKQIYSELTKFTQFQNPYISKISHETLQEYLSYCYKLGNTTNTAWKSFKFLRTILSKALKEKVIEEDPFLLFEKPKYKDPPRKYLTKSQVLGIEKDLPIKGKDVQFAGYWFLISCYTGLRFSDLQSFNKKKIRDGRLVIYTAKTGEIVSLPVKGKIKELFEKVDYKPIPYTNTHYNRLLKLVSPGLTSHTGRHTCAVMLADAGVSIEVVGKILGHSSIKSTAVYFKITNKRIDDELGRIF
jgi:site-specific recombinase XerD